MNDAREVRRTDACLSAELVSAIFPIARSDRRKHKDLFTELISEDQLKDDGAFYRGLARALTEKEYARLRTYDGRMIKSRQTEKSFGHRALRWLVAQSAGTLTMRTVNELSPDHFPRGSNERAVHDIYLGMVMPRQHAAKSLGVSEPIAEVQVGVDWAVLARELAGKAHSLSRPDVEEAERLVVLAQELAAVCRDIATATANQQSVAARLAALEERVREFGIDPRRGWPDGLTNEILDRVEEALDGVATTQQSVLEAEQALDVADAELRSATDQRAYTRIPELSNRAAEAEDLLRTCRHAKDKAFAALAALLQSRASGPPVSDDGASLGIAEADLASDVSAESPARNAELLLPVVPASPQDFVGQDEAELSPLDDKPLSVGLSRPVSEVAVETSLAAKPQSSVPDPSRSALPTVLAQIRSVRSPDQAVLLADYLAAGEAAFAYHLTRLAPEAIAVPTPVLQALVILPAIQRAEDMADPTRSGALAELAAALPEAADPVAAGRLAFAALLRPALFDPDHGARDHLDGLKGHTGLEAHDSLIKALSGLGYDVRLSIALLAQLAGTRVPLAEPEARKRLDNWLVGARQRQSVHQPTHAIFHQELRRDNELGRVLEAALSGAPDADALVQELVDRLSHNRSAQETLIRGAERRTGRPRRDRIEGTALDWFCRGLQEACDQLSEWLESKRQDFRSSQQDPSPDRLLRALGPVRKALDASISALAGIECEGDLARAANRVLSVKLEDLRTIIDGRISIAGSPRPRDLLEGPLLRLPAGCQDWTDEDSHAYRAEREIRDLRLYDALSRPDCIAINDDAAFEKRLSEQGVLCAQRILVRLRERGEGESELRAREQQLHEVLDASRRQAKERIARLRQSLTTIGYLELDVATTLSSDLARLAIIDEALDAQSSDGRPGLPALNSVRIPGLPADFPELDVVLNEMEARRDNLRSGIGSRQRDALARLSMGPQGPSATALLAIFDSLDPVTVDDAIAELSAGRAVPLSETSVPDAFSRFFPGFVSDVAAASEETARGRVLDVLTKRDPNGQPCIREQRANPLDVNSLDQRRANRLKHLLESWGQSENALRQGNPQRLREGLLRLFGLIGFTGPRVTEGREALRGRLRLLTLDCDVPRTGKSFVPPAFGSSAGGRYQLLAASADVSADQLLRQIGSEAPDAPWLVLLFGRLSVNDRARLARQTRSEARLVLVLDETLLLFSGLEGEDPLVTFLECALPFSWVQPYSTTAGQIPFEVFFGREAEIERIVAKDGGGCLIYGGRQLGKSVLLNHIRSERHRPDDGELAIYMDIKPIGGIGQPAARIWHDMAFVLASQPGFDRLDPQPNLIIAAIEEWLGRDPSWRILAMFDEADNFLRAEHAAGYPNLQRLKGLMERTGRRFKAVFAGLHNVRRMARAPNSPLPHLGEPICVGPMNQSPDNRAALRRLAVEPMRTAGLDYADPNLAADMLARMNYYPSLVQVFGRQIVESFGRRPRPGIDGPRWRLDRGSLFEGAAAERIAEQIRDRFQLTLNLDVRYDCIARSIALHRLESVGGSNEVLAQGLRAGEIRRITHWPKVLPEPAMADFEELLEELVDLGVLTRFPDRRYGLRNAQVAQMLGERDDLEDALLQLDEREDDPAYDSALYFRSLRPLMPNARAPLADRELDRLFDPKNPGLRLLRISREIVGPNIAERIIVAAKLWIEQGDHVQLKPDKSQLRRALDRVKSGPVVIVVDGDWTIEIARHLAQQPKVLSGEVLPVWCSERWAEPVEGTLVFDAGPWSDAMLRHWLADEGLAPALDDSRTRAALMAATGGAPVNLELLRPSLSDLGARPVSDRIERLANSAKKLQLDVGTLGFTNLDLSCLATIRDIEDQDPTTEDLKEFCSDATDTRLEKLVAMGVLRRGRTPQAAPMLTPLGRLLAK